jgi:subtilase family serine protease
MNLLKSPWMRMGLRLILAGLSAFLIPEGSVLAQAVPQQQVAVAQWEGRQVLGGRVPSITARSQPIDRLPAANRLDLAISLPLRNKDELDKRLQRIYDPASPDYRHWLTAEQFAEMFGPTKEDYQALDDFAKKSDFEVTGTHPNRTLLDVRASVADIERALHVRMDRYQHPTENRTFFAPDAEPSLDLALPVLYIAGLNDFVKPHAGIHKKTPGRPRPDGGPKNTGSGPGGLFLSKDLRAAYAPGVTLTGSGQTVGLFSIASGFFQEDITAYEAVNGLPNVPIMEVLLDGFNGVPSTNNNGEITLDIEMAMSMAPGLSQILVYDGLLFDDILNRMATDNLAKQMSCSWFFDPIDSETEQIYQQFAAQGQSFFNISGDGDAWVKGDGPFAPMDDPYITIVGGTVLTTSGPEGAWTSETVWNDGPTTPGWAGLGCLGSSGGISTTYSIPNWQANVNMLANHGSTTMRNVPDVAFPATGLYAGEGTSAASPLWASFMALVNEQALAGGRPTVGFINPAIYAIGQSPAYSSCFHDITTGNNTNSRSPNLFYAVTGYDLCTGWGTPAGIGLINALALPDSLQILPTAGFNTSGGFGGSFSIASQTFTLTNAGTNAVNWTIVNPAVWLTAPLNGGALMPGMTALVNVGLNSAASNLAIGTYTATIWFTNLNDSVGFGRRFTLSVLDPFITRQPTNLTLVSGETATIGVTAVGTAPFSYQWLFDGTNLANNSQTTGSQSNVLTLASVTAANSGTYEIVVTNALWKRNEFACESNRFVLRFAAGRHGCMVDGQHRCKRHFRASERLISKRRIQRTRLGGRRV